MSRPKNERNFAGVSVRIEENLLNRVDEYWRTHLMENRSELITDATRWYIDSVECPFCHARNQAGGRVCSVCLRPLTLDDEVNLLINVTNKKIENQEE